MTIEKEERFLLLLASYTFYLKGIKPSKSDVLDLIAGNDWIEYDPNDLEIRENRNELVWKNEFAFVRKHLADEGYYISNEKNNWGITEKGINYLQSLVNEIINTNLFNKVSNSAKTEAIGLFSKSEKKESQNKIESNVIDEIDDIHSVKGEEKYALIKIRVNQSTIKKRALELYKSKCILCGVYQKETLIASHIKSWADSNKEEKGDLNNILLLCPNHDSLFDKHLISFTSNGNILISDTISKDNQILLNINESMKIEMNEKTKQYMQWHRNIFEKIKDAEI